MFKRQTSWNSTKQFFSTHVAREKIFLHIFIFTFFAFFILPATQDFLIFFHLQILDQLGKLPSKIYMFSVKKDIETIYQS